MRAKAFYKALLRCYPAAFRHEYGDQMLLTFAEQLGEARRTGSRLRPAALWVDAALDTLTIAPKEHCHVILQDLRYAFRTMAASPGFTAVAMLSLALGMGANTAIFSLWNAVLHRSLPVVRNAGQLVMLSNPDDSGMWTGRWDGRTDGPRSWLTYGEFEQLRDTAGCFSGLMASQSGLDTCQVRFDGGDWEEARGRLVSGGYFQVLGVGPAIGRVFTTAEDRAATPTAVISYNYWQHRFGGRPDVLGKTVAMRKVALTIIGVAPRGFIGETNGQQPDLWIPVRMQPSVIPGRDLLHDTPPSKAMWLNVFGRLKAGVTLAQAEGQANAVFQAGLESFYGALASGERRREFLDQRIRVRPAARGASQTRFEFSTSLNALLAAVGVLLLIACANLANLLLARGAARKPEIALRLSLGASRARLVRQLVTESLALAAMGGAAGLGTAWFLHGALVRMMAEADRDFQMSFALDPRGAGLRRGRDTRRGAVIRGASCLAGHRKRCRSGSQGTGPWRYRLARAYAAGPLAGESATGALFAFAVWRRVVGADGLQPAACRPRLSGGTPAAGAAGFARGGLRHRAPRQCAFPNCSDSSGGFPACALRVFRNWVCSAEAIPRPRVEVEGYASTGDDDHGSAMDVVGPGYFSTLGVPMLLGREILESDRGRRARSLRHQRGFCEAVLRRGGTRSARESRRAMMSGVRRSRWWVSRRTRARRGCATTWSRATLWPPGKICRR